MKEQIFLNGKGVIMGYSKYEEAEEIIDWDAIKNQPPYYRNQIVKGKKPPIMKKHIRKEKRKEENKDG